MEKLANLILAAIFGAGPLLAVAQERSPIRTEAEYSVRFLCAGSSEGFQEGVVRGVYATSISLHNPSAQRSVSFIKTVARGLPFQRSGATGAPVATTMPPLSTLEVECDELRMMLPASMTAQFRSGVLAINASGLLHVTAVYSSRPHNADVSTIDVEVIEARVPVVSPPEDQVDLAVTDIDMESLRVTCGGARSCRSMVQVTVANLGSADSDETVLRTTFDPRQSVMVNTAISGGLSAGESRTLSIHTGRSGNCYDPNCQICAEIDPDNAITESNETNNRICRERAG